MLFLVKRFFPSLSFYSHKSEKIFFAKFKLNFFPTYRVNSSSWTDTSGGLSFLVRCFQNPKFSGIFWWVLLSSSKKLIISTQHYPWNLRFLTDVFQRHFFWEVLLSWVDAIIKLNIGGWRFQWKLRFSAWHLFNGDLLWVSQQFSFQGFQMRVADSIDITRIFVMI